MSELKNIDSVLDDFAAAVIERAQRNLGATRTVNGKKRRAVSTGNLQKSLSFVKSDQSQFTYLNFTATGSARQYANVVEYGRRAFPGQPEKRPPVIEILRWMKNKPVRVQKKGGGGFAKFTTRSKKYPQYFTEQVSAAVAISKSIGKNGIPALFYYRDAVQQEFEVRGPQFIDALNKEIAIRFNLGR